MCLFFVFLAFQDLDFFEEYRSGILQPAPPVGFASISHGEIPRLHRNAIEVMPCPMQCATFGDVL